MTPGKGTHGSPHCAPQVAEPGSTLLAPLPPATPGCSRRPPQQQRETDAQGKPHPGSCSLYKNSIPSPKYRDAMPTGASQQLPARNSICTPRTGSHHSPPRSHSPGRDFATPEAPKFTRLQQKAAVHIRTMLLQAEPVASLGCREQKDSAQGSSSHTARGHQQPLPAIISLDKLEPGSLFTSFISCC